MLQDQRVQCASVAPRNYAPGVLSQVEAAQEGCDQVLWLFGPDYEITEVGSMNAFVFWKTPSGSTPIMACPVERQLITPPLDGTILPGVTRDSILQLCRQWNSFDVLETRITMSEVLAALTSGRILEIFGSGTAAVITPVRRIRFKGKDYDVPMDPQDPSQGAGPLARRLWDAIVRIQYGDVPHEWSILVD